MKKKFKQWQSSILPILAKQPNTSHLNLTHMNCEQWFSNGFYNK